MNHGWGYPLDSNATDRLRDFRVGLILTNPASSGRGTRVPILIGPNRFNGFHKSVSSGENR
jgi:hypothetical protein